jgi:hypothetical protein
MYVCPYDSQWCVRPECRAGSCELTGEQPAFACEGCGAVVHPPVMLRLCLRCVFVDTRSEKESP